MRNCLFKVVCSYDLNLLRIIVSLSSIFDFYDCIADKIVHTLNIYKYS